MVKEQVFLSKPKFLSAAGVEGAMQEF